MPFARVPAPAPAGTDALVDATPASRDRVVDLLRAASICVVVLWHWSLSVTHWHAGRLTMPNPVGDVPGLWAATWVLQVMPVFFVVGGYANLAGWQAVTRDGGGARRFVQARLARLGGPVVPWLGCWLVADLAAQAAGGRSVTDWGMVVFVPLWFLGVYAGVVAAVPLTARLHARARRPAARGAGGGHRRGRRRAAGARPGRAGRRAGRIGAGVAVVPPVGLLLAGRLAAGGRTRRAAAVAAAGLAALFVLTGPGPYPHSMVAVRGEAVGNMFPTSACIAALAAVQLGLALLARPRLEAWLARRGAWRAVVAANGLAMPVFCWHMTALVVFLGLYERAGFVLADRPTAGWWLSRPLWVVGPGLVLVALLAGLRRLGRRRRGN